MNKRFQKITQKIITINSMTAKPMLGNSATDEEVKSLTRPELMKNLKHAKEVNNSFNETPVNIFLF